MKTKVLYSQSYPIDENSNYWYFESPSPANYNSEALKLIKEYYVFTEIELPISTNEIIRTNLKVYKKLGKNNSPITEYTIQYEDRSNNTIIRADNYHLYPHIDLQLPPENKEKKLFDTDPSDYEASINAVLRYAEFYNSRTVGIDYWLFNLTTFKRELIHSFFNSARRSFDTSTAYTDVARLVCVDMLTAKAEINYTNEKLASSIVNKFLRCKIYEEKHNRPLKISKNLIQTEVDVNLLPFPIFITTSITAPPFILKIFDTDGNELPTSGSFFPLGKTTFPKD
jgi:hypothetical protein